MTSHALYKWYGQVIRCLLVQEIRVYFHFQVLQKGFKGQEEEDEITFRAFDLDQVQEGEQSNSCILALTLQ